MDDKTLRNLLDGLIETWENEVIEFKRAGNDYSTDKIGKYFSALSNETNLRNIERSWLVFGVDNKTRKIFPSDYRPESERLQSLKMQIAENTEPSITFRDIHELITPEGRVILFEIPVAPQGLAIAWKGHYYARAGESLTSLSMDKLDEIRNQTSADDWTAQVVAEATLEHLDPHSLETARDSFAQKYANRFSYKEVMEWNESTFLDRSRLTKDGEITRATLLLLGKGESSHLLLPHPAQITWKLDGAERAYEHFAPPFLLNTTALYQKIRNFQVRILPEEALIATEVAKYDQKVILEALHNCIAHQDYRRNGRIIVTEFQDRLVLENEGGFYEGHPDDYIMGRKTPRRYRNSFLTQAMTELNMIDTMGYGIYEMHLAQARRYFPLPDYDLTEPNAVRMTIHGKVVDPAYSRLLMQETNLDLSEILALDRVQKKLPLPDDTIRRLRRLGLIEGRKPNLYVSAIVAKVTSNKADYIRTRPQDNAFYTKLITDYLEKFGGASRKEINTLLWDKLSDLLDDTQKTNKISSLLTNLRRSGYIKNTASKKASRCELAE